MGRWADFRGSSPGSGALRAAGLSGVLRYVGLGSTGKRITSAEVADYLGAAFPFLLVAELGTDDAWVAADDHEAGRAAGRAALSDARSKGVPDTVGIACAADAHATASQVRDAVEYARGFAEVVGRHRAGFYGFAETLRAVRDAGVVSWYWLAGSAPSAADRAWVHLWQRNVAPSSTVVGGTTMDLNDVINPVGGDMPLTKDDVALIMNGRIDYVNLDGKPAESTLAAMLVYGVANPVNTMLPIVKTLAGLLAAQDNELTAQQVEDAVSRAIAANVVHVAVSVSGDAAADNAPGAPQS